MVWRILFFNTVFILASLSMVFFFERKLKPIERTAWIAFCMLFSAAGVFMTLKGCTLPFLGKVFGLEIWLALASNYVCMRLFLPHISRKMAVAIICICISYFRLIYNILLHSCVVLIPEDLSRSIFSDSASFSFYLISFFVLFTLSIGVIYFLRKKIDRYNWVPSSHFEDIDFKEVVIFLLIMIMVEIEKNLVVSEGSLLIGLTSMIILLVLESVILSGLFTRRVNQYKQAEYLRSVKNYNEDISEMNRELSIFRHDYRNILATMSSMILNEQHSALKEYFFTDILATKDQIETGFDDFNSLSSIENHFVRSLLYTKYLQAKEQGVRCIFSILNTAFEEDQDPVRLCRILGILIDNAIEAAAQTSHKKIYIISETAYDGQTEIKIINHFNKDESIPAYSYIEGVSSKQHHSGIGLANVNQLKKNLLDISFKIIDDQYCVFVKTLQ